MNREEHPFVAIAREAIRQRLETGRGPALAEQDGDPPARGVFVSLHESVAEGEGPLRGCVGSIEPREPNLRTEIARSAVAAAFSDPRFPPLTAGEVEQLDITVYLLEEPEPVAAESELDPLRYGVIVQSRGRRGLLLPAIPGIDSASAQLAIARQKAGLLPVEPADIYRFQAEILH
ncbi:MAG: AmmeMemoRadiSam system protein A [Acidimicrobiia bacterium]|nr:AmmeMemoRadiSam system protein A [Acidimicrobiia bacterium]NNC91628.1 AmmeMemoRadiSam system protein A [Acidimicrobiia bacterium]